MRLASSASSVQVMQERLPVSGRMANGPAGRKCWTARAPWMRALLVVVGVGVTLHVARLPSVQAIAAQRAEGSL